MIRDQQKNEIVIGVISDTHGLFRKEIADIFKGVDLIAHAGDIDRPIVLEALKEIAPVTAVRGNVDGGLWTKKLRPFEAFEVGGISIYMLHNLDRMDLIPEDAGFDVVISGHTHYPKIEKNNGVLFLNPGSAGPIRYDYPVSVARLHIFNKTVKAEIVELEP